MKFQIGDKVRVKKDLVIGEQYGGLTFFEGMQCDEEGKIFGSFFNEYGETYMFTGSRFWYSVEMLELVSECDKPANEEIEKVHKATAKEILNNIKAMLVDRYDYFSGLRNKNVIAGTESSKENALFVGEMDCANCLIDRIEELAKEYGVEVD